MQRKQSEPFLSRYLHTKGRAKGLPIAGNFELTARCNFDCPMCYVHLKQEDVEARGRELTTEQWIGLAREARDAGMVFVLLTGGEPFVRKDFFEIYGAMKKMGLLVSINSNGSMLTGEIRQKLIEDPPFRVNVSLYGGCPETYRSMCGQDAFNRVVENIRCLKEAGIDVRINLSITGYNRQDMEKIWQISQELGVHVKAASYMFPSIRVNDEQFGQGDRLCPEDAAACAVRWDRLRFAPEEFAARARAMQALTAAESSDCPTELESGVRCRAGSTSFWMTWDGRMLPCGMMTWPVTRPLDVSFGEAWKQLRQKTAEIKSAPGCVNCPKKDVCSVCAASRVAETGSFEQVPEYICRYTDALIEKTWAAYQESEDEYHDH